MTHNLDGQTVDSTMLPHILKAGPESQPHHAIYSTQALATRRSRLGSDRLLFFITIHCAQRNLEQQLTLTSVATRLLAASNHYEQIGRWFVRLFLLMPDHVHGLIAFPLNRSMRAAVNDWKRYTARETGTRWQRDFFDHRVRDGANWQQIADYIRANPVRAGIATTPEEWPWTYPDRWWLNEAGKL